MKKTAKEYTLAILQCLSGDTMVEIRQNWMDYFHEWHADTLKIVLGTSQNTLGGGVGYDIWTNCRSWVAEWKAQLRVLGCLPNLQVASNFSDGFIRPMTPKHFLKVSKILMEPLFPQHPIKLVANPAKQSCLMKMMDNGPTRMVSTMIEVLCNSSSSCIINLPFSLVQMYKFCLCLLSGTGPIHHWP